MLVAVSPLLPNTSLTTVEKLALGFLVLSDVPNEFVRILGIVWAQPESLRPVSRRFSNNLSTRKGDDSFEVLIPATLLVDQMSIVRNIFVHPDHMKRPEPEAALVWIEPL